MSEKKLEVTSADGAQAALMLNQALITQLAKSGVLSHDQANFVGAIAASMCRGGGNDNAARLIEATMPSCKDVNVTIEAMKQGFWMEKREGE